MPQEEFDSMMSGEKVYSSAWESALMACESIHMISENLKTIKSLDHRNNEVTTSVNVLNLDFDRLKVTHLRLFVFVFFIFSFINWFVGRTIAKS